MDCTKGDALRLSWSKPEVELSATALQKFGYSGDV